MKQELQVFLIGYFMGGVFSAALVLLIQGLTK